MRVEFYLLIKFCGTRTDPATETNGWRCRPTRWRRVFCSSPRQFHLNAKLTTLTRTWYYSQPHSDTKLSTVYQDWQKTRHRDADGT